MVACQVAHSIFNIPKKIARIRNQVFRDPAWANLFSRAHMPIDVIISPEVEVARAVQMRLSVPGTTSVVPMAEGVAHLCGVICEQNCPIVNTPLKQLRDLFPDMSVQIVAIVRNGRNFVPNGHDQMLIGDEVFFVSQTSQLNDALSKFGHEEKKACNVVVVGGGNIGLSLIQQIQEKHKDVSLKVIETCPDRAEKLSGDLENVLILNASGLDRNVLEEVNIAETETLIAVTNDDETNILTALLARQNGCGRVIPLVNKGAYSRLTASLGLGAILSPKAITVSTIMRHVRRGRIKAVHNLLNNFAEILEIEASENFAFLNTPLRNVEFPVGVVVCGILREDTFFIPDADSVIRSGDHVIILAAQNCAGKVEKMFSAQVDLF